MKEAGLLRMNIKNCITSYVIAPLLSLRGACGAAIHAFYIIASPSVIARSEATKQPPPPSLRGKSEAIDEAIHNM
jgi:hypothetical protein